MQVQSDSAAITVIYALFVEMVIYRSIRFQDLFSLFREGAGTAAIVMLIIATASVFSWITAIEEIPARLAVMPLRISTHSTALLLLINLVLLIAGTFVETTAALILLVPMITAMLPSLGIDLIQPGVIVVTNPAIGMLTPPMGICLIVSGTISGDGIAAVSRRILPFLGILLLDLLIITFYPPVTLWPAQLING